MQHLKNTSIVIFVLIAQSVCSCATLDSSLIEFSLYNDDSSQMGNTPGNQVAITVHQIMPLQSSLTPNAQGGACWGDWFFQFSNYNNYVRVYNLAEKTLKQNYSINAKDKGFVKNCHCNSVCFGSSYFSEMDEFPLLYVSTGYTKDGFSGVLVYRVIKIDDLFSFTLVQTIRLPVLNSSSWTEFIPAGEYCYVGYTGDFVYGGDVILDGNKDAIEVFQFPPQPEKIKYSSNQGKLYHNGKIIYPSGIPQIGEDSVFFFLDLKSKTYEHIFSFPELGLYKEPESVFFWRNSLCVAFVDQIVSFEFTPSIF